MARAMRANNGAGTSEFDIAVSQMAGLVELQLSAALTAFERRDIGAAEKIVLADKRIDDMQRKLDAGAMQFLMRPGLSPSAVREAVVSMKTAGELERIGDLAKNVAKRTLVISLDKPMGAAPGVARMGRASLRQLAEVLTAYAGRNLEAAQAVWGGDDDLDELYNSVYREILSTMMSEPEQVSSCTHLVFIAKNFERVGDHATNVAEALHLLVTGELFSGDRPKGDETSTSKPPA